MHLFRIKSKTELTIEKAASEGGEHVPEVESEISDDEDKVLKNNKEGNFKKKTRSEIAIRQQSVKLLLLF